MKVSVIIPVYNAEKWIERCLESIIEQTYKNLEVIVVDDGCKDDTLKIVKDYVEKDQRIFLIEKEHTGLHYTRKRGIKEASGDAIFQCDQDDFLQPNGIELLVKKMLSTNADLVIGNHYQVMDGKKVLVENSVPENSDKVELLKSLLKNDIKGYPWAKLFRRHLLLDLDLSMELAFLEDVMTSIHVLARHDVKAVLEEKPVYNYIIHGNSTSSTKNQALIETIPQSMLVVEKILDEQNLLLELEKEFSAFKCRSWIVYSRLGGKLAKSNTYKKKVYNSYCRPEIQKELTFYQVIELLVYRHNSYVGQWVTRTMKRFYVLFYKLS